MQAEHVQEGHHVEKSSFIWKDDQKRTGPMELNVCGPQCTASACAPPLEETPPDPPAVPAAPCDTRHGARPPAPPILHSGGTIACPPVASPGL